ncbi:unnamed protein product [Didymodactylos carnosus]|uniref:Uncharacterized protein n=1 Tax=Didymodactylos carnosus TaxID=1234261 RepID=A0A814YB76_9BILA|nr:unnamed protein product [Didymodactylos carnosus]CAF1228056.1 unnamed protein product [Didymodactylos carnosus]CAF3688932.1 unnamed protein product [Didymodactylos carnosus]CAF3990879.1 unnamed protein product [Didymodactylos carnosus]
MTRLFHLDVWSPYLAHYPYDHRRRRINKESITLVWFDLCADDEDNDGELIERLRAINDFSLIYHDLDVCRSYAESVNTEKILLVTSNAGACAILPALNDLVQLDSVFIFDNADTIADSTSHAYSTTKLVGMSNDWANLEKTIIATIIKLRKHMDLFNYFDQNQSSTHNITEQQSDFLW